MYLLNILFHLQNALLHETTEEWEQCEKKLREVRAWINKTKGGLDQGAGKKKPLRDQLATKEKVMADITIQKSKISVSIEKLQVIEIDNKYNLSLS